MLQTKVKAPLYDSKDYTDVPVLDAVVVAGADERGLTVFAVNKDLAEGLALECDLRGFGRCRVVEHLVLEQDDLKAANTAQEPLKVAPHAGGRSAVEGAVLKAVLNRHSWNVIRLERLT